MLSIFDKYTQHIIGQVAFEYAIFMCRFDVVLSSGKCVYFVLQNVDETTLLATKCLYYRQYKCGTGTLRNLTASSQVSLVSHLITLFIIKLKIT